MRSLFFWAMATLTCILSLSGPIQAATRYYFHDLGSLAGGTKSEALGINDAGQVVGWSENGDTVRNHRAFLKVPGQPMQDLGALGEGNEFYSEARGINNFGQIVGAAENTHHVYHAFLKNNGQPMQDLGVLGGELGNPSHSEAYAINDFSQVVGGSTLPYNGNLHAFLKNPGQEMQDLGTLGKDLSLAFGINDSGQAVGVCGAFPTAFLKKPGEPMEDLGSLSGGDRSRANGINNAGQVVGWSATANNLIFHAFLKNPGQEMQDLGDLGGGYSEAYAINDAGQIVGVSATSVGSVSSKAVLWEKGVMHDLSNLTVNLPSGVFLYQARAINNKGWIVGQSSNERAFLLTTTTPLPLLLLLDK